MSEDTTAPKEASWDSVAKELGVTRQSLVNWRGRPGAPQGRDVGEWRAYIEAEKLGGQGKRGSELRDEKIRYETELIKAKIDREKRRVIPTEEVNALLLHIATTGKTLLYQFMETEAPPKLDGLAAAQMRPILREMADAISDKMADLIKDFEQR